MDDKLITAFISIITAVIGVSVLSVILSPKAQTANVLGAASGGFAQILNAATAPITGGSSSSGILGSLAGLGSLTNILGSSGGSGALSLGQLDPGGFGG